MDRAPQSRRWVLLGVGVTVIVVLGIWVLNRPRDGDALARVRDALLDKYAMAQLPEEEGFDMGDGWLVRTYLSGQSPAATLEEVRATIAEACKPCVIGRYGQDAMLVSHRDYASRSGTLGGDPGYSRFIIVTWEGPLGKQDDGGLTVIDVRREDNAPSAAQE